MTQHIFSGHCCRWCCLRKHLLCYEEFCRENIILGRNNQFWEFPIPGSACSVTFWPFYKLQPLIHYHLECYMHTYTHPIIIYSIYTRSTAVFYLFQIVKQLKTKIYFKKKTLCLILLLYRFLLEYFTVSKNKDCVGIELEKINNCRLKIKFFQK